jgi:hypothetical protein
MRFSLVVVGALAGLATALPQRAIANGKSRVGRPDGQNNQNNAAQPSQPPQAVSTGTPNAQAPAAAAPNGKGNGAQSGNQNTPTGAANNQPAQNTPAAGNNNGNGKNNGNNGNGISHPPVSAKKNNMEKKGNAKNAEWYTPDFVPPPQTRISSHKKPKEQLAAPKMSLQPQDTLYPSH